MKIILFLSLFLFIGSSAFSQKNENFDSRLLSKYSKEQIAQLLNEQPQIIAYWTYYLDNAYTIADIPEGKEVEFDGEVNFKNAESFNIFESSVEMNRTRSRFYAIENNPEKMLVLYSGDMITQRFNQQYSPK